MKTILIICLVLISFGDCLGVDISFVWNANSETDLAGYKVYYGYSSQNYGQPVDVGNTTEYQVLNLTTDIYGAKRIQMDRREKIISN